MLFAVVEISAYIVRIERERLTPDNRKMLIEILNSVSDYERIGDYCMNIVYTADEISENGIVFSPAGSAEVRSISEATEKIIDMSFTAFETENSSQAYKVLPLAGTIARLKDVIESHHVERLQDGNCGVAGGVALYDLVNSFERIAMHSKTISKHIITSVLK